MPLASADGGSCRRTTLRACDGTSAGERPDLRIAGKRGVQDAIERRCRRIRAYAGQAIDRPDVERRQFHGRDARRDAEHGGLVRRRVSLREAERAVDECDALAGGGLCGSFAHKHPGNRRAIVAQFTGRRVGLRVRWRNEEGAAECDDGREQHLSTKRRQAEALDPAYRTHG